MVIPIDIPPETLRHPSVSPEDYHHLGPFYTPWTDVLVLLHLVRTRRPSRFLEIGTNRGITTRILADQFPDMTLVTVDPGDQVPAADRPAIQRSEYPAQDRIGECVRDCPNVTVIRRKVQEVDWAGQRFEMIFVDGNHSLPHVLDDSRLALRLMTDPGVVVWHDYNNVPDVKSALDQLEVPDPIRAVKGTWIAYLDTGPGIP